MTLTVIKLFFLRLIAALKTSMSSPEEVHRCKQKYPLPFNRPIARLDTRLNTSGVGATPSSEPNRPLRVRHIIDAGQRHSVGRMVISGRMADVCAELDRLAACEAAM